MDRVLFIQPFSRRKTPAAGLLTALDWYMRTDSARALELMPQLFPIRSKLSGNDIFTKIFSRPGRDSRSSMPLMKFDFSVEPSPGGEGKAIPADSLSVCG
jgi:hypothetical protein